jgi:uncharacterized membrane protein (UPF0182 family)
MFKVQRYQFARYHVTDPNQWFQDNNRWDVPEDPNGAKSLQPPYRMFITQPPGLVVDNEDGNGNPASSATPAPSGPTWSLTSTFVPYKRSNLAAYVSVDSDATSQTYGQMRVINVLDDQQQGPGQVANAVRSDQDVADALAQFNRSGSNITYGNLLTVPVGDELMYVEPIYASLSSASESTFPILRYVLVSYQGGVGIDTTLTGALEKAKVNAGTSGGPQPTPEPSPSGEPSPSSTPTSQPSGNVQDLLQQAQQEFIRADQALADGDLAAYQEHIKKAQELVNEAVAQQGGAGPSASPSGSSPSGTSPSSSATP